MAKATLDDSPHGLMLLMHKEPMGGAGPHDKVGGDALPAGLEDAAEDLIHAMKSDDATMVAHALHDCWSMCQGQGDDAESAASGKEEPADDNAAE